ncbi:MAG: ABC transporter ATP-binding protein [Saprospiraceae bacterium]|nr:ABC transporter ATP-binding protein [Saprospiraceae bacterium]
MSFPIISLQGLNKSYGHIKAIDGLNLDVNHNIVFGFLGPNGAGKSTCLRMMLSLISPDSGTIRIFNKDLKTQRSEIMSHIGSIVEKPDFYLFLSAKDNLKILAQLNKVNPTEHRIHEILELVGLSNRASDKVKTFSHGMKQRLGLAQALIHDPALIILDEPTTGLDPQGIIDLRLLILQLKTEAKKTILLSSHILSEIELVADEMVIINKGKSIVQGKVNDLMSDQDLILNVEISDVHFAKQKILERFPDCGLNIIDQYKIQCHLSRAEIPIVNELLRHPEIKIYALHYKRRLEDYFLKLTAS